MGPREINISSNKGVVEAVAVMFEEAAKALRKSKAPVARQLGNVFRENYLSSEKLSYSKLEEQMKNYSSDVLWNMVLYTALKSVQDGRGVKENA